MVSTTDKSAALAANIGISEANRKAVSRHLAILLADEFILYTKTRRAHWNVEGADFHSMHLFFEGQYGQLADYVDDIAERIRQLGHYAPATLADYLQLTRLSEQNGSENSSAGFIRELLLDHEELIMVLRGLIRILAEENNDAGTSDFVTGLMEKHEKMAWMLRAHL